MKEGWEVRTGERVLIGPGAMEIRLGSASLFFLMAFLAYRRSGGPEPGGWVTIPEIGRLPGWRSHSQESIGKEVQRYVRSRELYPIAYEKVTRGRYRFDARPDEIAFDVETVQVEEMLEIAPTLQPLEEDAEAAQSSVTMRFVQALARAEGTRFAGWSRSEYLESVDRLRGLCEDGTVPRTLRFLGLDRILNMDIYSHGAAGIEGVLSHAQQIAGEETASEAASWMTHRVEVHRVRLLLRQGMLEEGEASAAQALRSLEKGGGMPESRTVADLYNSAGIARARLSQGDRETALQALGLLYRALELRLLSLGWDEVHDSCLNLSLCLANDLGDVPTALRWMAAADAVREACSVGSYSGLPDFAVVSMLRRFPGEGTPLRSKKLLVLLREIGMVDHDRTTVEQFVEERLASGFKRSQDFDDERGLLAGYRTRASIRWQQKRPREAFEDVVRFVHTARKLDEDLAQHARKLTVGKWEQPLRMLSDWAWALRLKGRSIEGVPPESFASYLEELEEWLERRKGE